MPPAGCSSVREGIIVDEVQSVDPVAFLVMLERTVRWQQARDASKFERYCALYRGTDIVKYFWYTLRWLRT